MADGCQRFFHHRRSLAAKLLRQYHFALSPSSTGWGSQAPQSFSCALYLQIEARLLGCAFDRWVAVFPPRDYRRMAPELTFTRSHFANPTHWPLISPAFPDLRTPFGDLAPLEHKVYSTSCHLQRRSDTNFTVCFDTGCTMSSTFSLDDFEEPPVKGRFGQLRTINHVVPIEATGIIRWHVLDSEGTPAVIRVPGYYIPSSGQRLLSPQSYMAYHQWADPTTNCYGGNDQQFWMQLTPASPTADCQLLTVAISALDGLPYIKGQTELPASQPCSSCSHTRQCAGCSHAFNLSVLAPQNKNLTAAQSKRCQHVITQHCLHFSLCQQHQFLIIGKTAASKLSRY